MKVAIVAVMVVLAMGTAFVGGLLVALKMVGAHQDQPVKTAPAAPAAPTATMEGEPKEGGAKEHEGDIVKDAGKKAKNEPKKPTTDELIALLDYSATESRDIGKLLFRKKLAENYEAAEKQQELESDQAKEKKRLATAIERWLERSSRR